MKYLIASDIHGSAQWAGKLCDAIAREAPDTVILLGDLLYHGPRNPLPDGYDPMRVAGMLDAVARERTLIAVRGNCDSEVDQMVLGFPCMADYALVSAPGGQTLFATHGHVFGSGERGSADNAPSLEPGSALLFGHTHVKVSEPSRRLDGLWLFNPGSVSIPKDGTHSYGVYEEGGFAHRIL